MPPFLDQTHPIREKLTGPSVSVAVPRAIREALAWSRLVSRAKLVLPALSALLIVMIAVWPLFIDNGDPRQGSDDPGQLEMQGARFRGTDTGRRPFEVRFERAVQMSGDAIDMVRPEAEMTLDGGQWITVSAERGRYDEKSGHLSLSGNVTLFHDGGYEFQTEEAELDTGKGLVWGNRPVRGQGPAGFVDAGGFRVVQAGDVVIFTGKARLRLVPQPRSEG